MAKKTRNKKPASRPSVKKAKKKGISTEELTRKHMSDPNHSISDEELKNIEIDLHVATSDPLDLPDSDERPHDVDKDRRISTPWDVIKES